MLVRMELARIIISEINDQQVVFLREVDPPPGERPRSFPILIGLFEAAWSALVSIEHRDAAVFVALSVLLVLRPGGFFGRPGLEPRR